MAKQRYVYLLGSSIAIARNQANLKNYELSDLAVARKFAHAELYANALKLSAASLSRIINSSPGDRYSHQKQQTVQLLADVLRVQVESFYAPREALSGLPLPLADPSAVAAAPRTSPGPDDEIPAGSSPKGSYLPCPPEQPPLAEPSVGNDAVDYGYLGSLPHVLLPFVSVATRRAFVARHGASNPGQEPTLRYNFPIRPMLDYTNNAARVFEVKGDCMDPEIRSGEYVVADLVPEPRWELLSNTIVVILYDDTLTVRRIKENELMEKGILTLYPREGLAPLAVRGSLIHQIYVVRESFERKVYSQPT